MNATLTPAADLTDGDTIDLSPALTWLRSHADGPTDGLTLAVDLAAFDYATIIDIDTETHAVTGEDVIVIHNTIYDVAIPATLVVPRITA